MQRIAVLMTCYNRAAVTLSCLRSLARERDILRKRNIWMDVWLVDDGCTDETAAQVRDRFKEVNIVASTGNLFWSRGMRLAWESARAAENYDFYLWVNDDVTLKEGAIEDLIDDYAACGGVIVGTFSSDKIEKDVSYGATKTTPTGYPRVGDSGMNGNLVLVPKNVYDKVGMIYEGYWHQYGDYDYGWMVRKNGFEYYASSRYSGVCPEQPERYQHLKGRTLADRLKLLWSPKGYYLRDAFIYRRRRNGLVRAILSVVHVVLIVALGVEVEK